ncbi:CPBP family intramembrane glutamic endopeptidase [Antrihabitans sp. YC2-6]|uniref:CPBP family intramembrane glutamic endopeptidase n=1 Tax=Antrihabitans sp. YC2-6 TaxID=2799498 RepID=UPI0018F7CF14|nr:CPBP family intramembrane glutamic endopeptidase [Antrihabitans sp. YC2-6]MBJ8346314.1 CPBP family intramembrane metalloprotease [Antrihabitans sp. YC2-6]
MSVTTEPLDARERRGIQLEILIVLIVTFGLSGLSAAISLVEAQLSPGSLADQTIALNRSASTISLIDLCYQLLRILRLCGWAALGLYLLWRSGIGPRLVGLARPVLRGDVVPGLGLAALIGLPGLALYLGAHALGLNVTIAASALADHWWRFPTLVLAAIANAVAEEVLVVGYLITRLRRLGWSENASLAASAVLRGSYHLYQGLGGGVGNLVMGLVFGRYWQRTNRLWPLLIAHATIDVVAYIGYALIHDHVGWLP